MRVSPCLRGGSQRSHISPRDVDSYETYRRRKASIYRSAGGAGRLARPSRRVCPSRREGSYETREPSAQELFGRMDCCSFCAVCHNTCKTNPISPWATPCPRRNCAKRTQSRPGRGLGARNGEAHCAEQSQFGGPLIYAKSVCGQRLAGRMMGYAAAKTKPIRGVEIASLRSQ
jgi:hypothetical protein